MKGWNRLGALEVFVIFLNVSIGITVLLGAITGYFGIVYADVINIPAGMDNEGMISTFMTASGYFSLTICLIALVGFLVLNFGKKMQKVFYAIPLGFAGLVLLIMGISLPIIKHNADSELQQMYEDCCAEHDVCCVNDPHAKKIMDDLHRRYNCCTYEGPEYFKKLDERTTLVAVFNVDRHVRRTGTSREFPESCCPKPAEGEKLYRCSAEKAYKVACKTKINGDMNPYVVTVEGYCFATAFFCGVVTVMIVLMVTLNIYMNKTARSGNKRGCKQPISGPPEEQTRRWSRQLVVGTRYIGTCRPRVGANDPKSLVSSFGFFSWSFVLVVSVWQLSLCVSGLCYRHSPRTLHTCLTITQPKVPRLHGYSVIASFGSAKLLPKLAISAKVLLCLLMVAISEGTPSVIRQVRLLNKGSSSWVNVNYKGLVSLKGIEDGYEDLRFISDWVGKLRIYGEKSNRWLCYNKRWKLVGKLNGTEGSLGDLCEYSEEMSANGYFIYRSKRDPKHVIGFRSDGRQIRGRRPHHQPSAQYLFSKIDEEFPDLISKHNEIISAPSSADQRSDYALPPHPVHTAAAAVRQRNNRHQHRHRHGIRRRKFPNNNTAAV